jgi:surface antigen
VFRDDLNLQRLAQDLDGATPAIREALATRLAALLGPGMAAVLGPIVNKAIGARLDRWIKRERLSDRIKALEERLAILERSS